MIIIDWENWSDIVNYVFVFHPCVKNHIIYKISLLYKTNYIV